jgi:pyruvate kinase
MLESMIQNPVPTRAEITDVANAVFEQTDAIMLSGETTIGRYPVECVQVLHRVALRIERSGGAGYAKDVLLEDARQKLVASAVVLANSLPGSKLIVFTRHGIMARHVANMRPQAPIFAFTPSEKVCRQLAMSWGACAIQTEFTKDPNKTIAAAESFLRDNKLAVSGDQLVILSDLRAGETLVDCVQLRTVK